MAGPPTPSRPIVATDDSATFDSLMPHRVHDILVVASPYDAFVIEEGGRLTELILNEYVSLNLTDAPAVTRAATAADALTHLAHKRFDLIFTMVHAGGMDGFTFARKAKELDPHTPVAMLAFDTGEMERLLSQSQRSGVDYMFTWHGDARLCQPRRRHRLFDRYRRRCQQCGDRIVGRRGRCLRGIGGRRLLCRLGTGLQHRGGHGTIRCRRCRQL